MPNASGLEELAKALTPKERLFAQFYVGEARRNATKAAELAGYKADNRNSLRAMGSGLLTKVNVRAYIDAFLDATAMTQAEIVAEISDIARQDLTPYLEDSGGELYLNYTKMKEDGKLHLIAGFEFNKQGDSIPLIHSKLAALTLLVRINRMGGDKVEHTGDIGVTVREYPEGV